MSKHNIQVHDKKEKFLNYLFSCAIGRMFPLFNVSSDVAFTDVMENVSPTLALSREIYLVAVLYWFCKTFLMVILTASNLQL